jgi:hypothetical protein
VHPVAEDATILIVDKQEVIRADPSVGNRLNWRNIAISLKTPP